MNKIEKLRIAIDKILHKNLDLENKKASFVHLYGVSTFCNMIAEKRKLDIEISLAIGMLHDISSYITNDPRDHNKYSSIEAEKILLEINIFSKSEIEIIKNAIYNHRNKNKIHDEYSELIKDADVLQHYYYNSTLPNFEKEKKRLSNLKKEFCL